MKSFSLTSIFFVLFTICVASTCSSDDSLNTVDPSPVINTVRQGTWKITFYQDSGSTQTSNFTGYNFTFGANGVLTAANSSNTITGTWSVTSDDSNDDSPSNDLDFNIGFASPSNFQELTEDWNIISYNDNEVKLIHVSGGNGGTDYVTFTKN